MQVRDGISSTTVFRFLCSVYAFSVHFAISLYGGLQYEMDPHSISRPSGNNSGYPAGHGSKLKLNSLCNFLYNLLGVLQL